MLLKPPADDHEAADDDPRAEDDSNGTGGAPVDEAHRLSQVLLRIAEDDRHERVAVSDLLKVMQERAFGPLMLVFALPNVIPTPPGTSTVLGAPLIFLTAQLMLGRSPWLPPIIARRSIARKDFAAFVAKMIPWLAKAETLLSPRFGMLARPPAEYAVGVMCFILAVVLVLPIPLGNMLPALAISVMALGILERDGLWVAAGMILGVISLAVVSGVIWAFVEAGLYLLRTLLG